MKATQTQETESGTNHHNPHYAANARLIQDIASQNLGSLVGMRSARAYQARQINAEPEPLASDQVLNGINLSEPDAPLGARLRLGATSILKKVFAIETDGPIGIYPDKTAQISALARAWNQDTGVEHDRSPGISLQIAAAMLATHKQRQAEDAAVVTSSPTAQVSNATPAKGTATSAAMVLS